MQNTRGSRSRMGSGGPMPNRFQRAVQSTNSYLHHQHPQQHPQHRLMNNMAWQQGVPNISNMSNMNNYHLNQGDNTMMPYQPQHIETYANYVPAMQSLSMPSPEMMNPNNQHVFQNYIHPANYIMSPLIHGPMSPVESVLISQPVNITTPPPPMTNSSSPLQTPMVNSPTNYDNPVANQMPAVKKPFDKFNSRDNLVRCSNCNHENHLAACELLNKDDEIARLKLQVQKLTNSLKYLANSLQQEQSERSQTAIKILQAHPSDIVVPKLSHLSPEAPEFRPEDHIVPYAALPANVPVVSAKVMNEDPVNDVQIDLDELTVEDYVKTESEDVTEEIAPNETPPEEVAAFNDEPELAPLEILEQQTHDVEVVEKENNNFSGPADSDADVNTSENAVTKVPQEEIACQDGVEEIACQDGVEESDTEELVALTDSSSQFPESGEDISPCAESRVPTSVTQSDDRIANEGNSRPATQMFHENQRGQNSFRGARDRYDSRGHGNSYGRVGRGGSHRTRNDSFNSDRPQQSIHQPRNQNQSNFTGRQHGSRHRRFGDGSQERKSSYRESSKDSYSDSKERNGQTDYRGKPRGESRGNPYKMANNNNQTQPQNLGDEFKNVQGRSSEDVVKRDYLTELKQKNNYGVARVNERRPHYKQYSVTEMKGDVFSAPVEFALGHCVAKDFRMGKGVAVKFKTEFKRVAELLDQNVDVGGCAHLKHNERYIFYLVTKEVSSGKPTMITMRQSLESLKEKCQNLRVNKLAIPHIGCGLDKLNWSQVRALINDVFGETGIVICAYDFNAEGLPEAEGNRANPTTMRVMYKIMPLVTIDQYTGLLFFGTEDGHLDSTAKSINNKFNFANDYQNAVKSVGKIWFRSNRNYYIYGLIVAKSATDKVLFTNVEQCCRELQKQLKKTETEYVGLEHLSDWQGQDNTFTEKVVTMLRNLLHKPVKEFWVCYREEEHDVYNMAKSSHD